MTGELSREPGAAASLPMTRGTVVVLATVIAVFFTLSNLGVKPLNDWDEAWHAIVGLDVARTNRFMTYTEDGELTSVSIRPPLHFAAMAIAFKLLGPTEFAARVFTALCHVGLVALVAWFCVRRLNWTVALVAALLLSTHDLLVFHHGARSADIDPPLVLFLSATMIAAYEWQGGRRCWWLGPAWAAALLTKGPAALQIVPALVVYLALERDWRRLGRLLLWLALGVVPLVIFLLVREQLQPGVWRGIVGEALLRTTTRIDGGDAGPLASFARLLAASLPLLLALAVAGGAVRLRPDLGAQLAVRSERGRVLRFLLAWWLVPAMLFSLVRTQKIWYFYPSLVPACILAAWVLRAALRRLECAGRRRVSGIAAAILLVGMVAPALWRSVTTRRADQELAGEYAELVIAIRLTGPAPLLAYRLFPADRFVLHLEQLAYQPVGSPEVLAALLAAAPGRALVVYRSADAQEMQPVLDAHQSTPRLRLARRGTELSAVDGGP